MTEVGVVIGTVRDVKMISTALIDEIGKTVETRADAAKTVGKDRGMMYERNGTRRQIRRRT
jgi:hypothetical protein